MVSVSSASQSASAVSLYRSLLRAAQGFSDYNFREYALRTVKNKFRETRVRARTQMDMEAARADGLENLEMMRRQALINRMYQWDPVVVERPVGGR
mmetsp:Transcript_17927/g.37195  ORF Transcript_17927/g.37195 Transcript_17927/m.37195 type:complete len:96 (+) Transcript_17927:28-315(+)